MQVVDLGIIDYEEAVEVQQQLVKDVLSGGEPHLLLLEHPPVISFGRNGGEENLPLPRDFFEKRGVALVKSSRGGNITCHFPGQLVAYPIMHVGKRPGGLKKFFYNMEQATINTLAHFGISAQRQDARPGVWLGSKKIASIGIAVSHWVSSHGLSLNVGKDLSLFNMVTPCGLPGVTATSIHRELDDEAVSMDEVKRIFTHNFGLAFELDETLVIKPSILD